MEQWFEQLRAVLPSYYPNDGPSDVVGYLQGSDDPNVWRIMSYQQGRHQMMILGSAPPTQQEWSAAGVQKRADVKTTRLDQLKGLIVLYAGFVYRPWGAIHKLTPEALARYDGTLASFRRNAPPVPRRPA